MATKKKPNKRRLIRRPGYQYSLDDLQEMVYQLGGRLQIAVYPAEFDKALETPPSAAAVDPHVPKK